MSTKLTFEHPLNERVRTFLRLEHLFGKVAYFRPLDDPWASRAAVEGLLDILSATARADTKTELLKELDRNTATLTRIRRQPGVDLETLGQILEDLQEAASGLHALNGQIGQGLRDDGLLKSVAQRSSIPGASCSFDLPQYHRWVNQPATERHRQLDAWLQDLQPVSSAIGLTLSLARSSATPRDVTATGGFFQEALDVKAPAQMVRVSLADQSMFPEISGHKNRFSIRFMQTGDDAKPLQYTEDITFTLTCCVF